MGTTSFSEMGGVQGSSKTGAETYSSAIAEAQNYMDWLVDTFQPYLQGRILEVGIGHGHYSTRLATYGEYLGIDLSESSIAHARANFPDQKFAACDILDRRQLRVLLPSSVDAIVSINVLEHIEDDSTAIANLVDVLKPGGHLLLSVPALAMLYNDLDRLAGHIRRYSKHSLRQVLQSHPVEILSVRYFNPIGGLGWWVNSLKHHQSLNADSVNAQIQIFDKYIVPLSRVADPLFRRFFGQSVIGIARRR
jgi:SAM-dependent methyltransferase